MIARERNVEVESEDDAALRYTELYGLQMIEEMKKRIPEWGRWSWAQRERILAAEQERLGLGNI